MKTYEIPKVRTTKGLKDYCLKDVNLVDDTFISGVQNLINDVEYYKIGSFGTGSSYFKYMDFDTALICLKKGTLRFAEPSMWDDQYESRLYNAIFSNVLNGQKEEDVCPLLYASCFTNKKDNEPAWKIYTYGKTGTRAKCVQFKLDRKELRGELIKKLSKCNVYEGCVSYFWQGFIDSIHRKKIKLVDVKLHSLFFDDFDFNKYLNLMLLKRDAFEHEHETRIMIVPINRSKKKSINGTGTFMDVKINWGRVIKEVRYDASITKSQKKELMDILKKLNNGIIVKPYYVNGRKSHITIGV